jgi:hypothetical protein
VGGVWRNQVGAKVRTRHTGNSEDPLNPSPRTIRLVNPTIEEWILDGGLEHYLVKCENAHGEQGVWMTPSVKTFVEGLNGNAADRLQVFFPEQAAGYKPPLRGGNISDGPTSSVTNAEWLAAEGKCYHAEITPATATARPGFYGLVKPL